MATGTLFLILPDFCFNTQRVAPPDPRNLPDLSKSELEPLLRLSGIRILESVWHAGTNAHDVEEIVKTALLNKEVNQLVLIGGNQTATSLQLKQLESISTSVCVIHWRWIMTCAIRCDWAEPQYQGQNKMKQPLKLRPEFVASL